MHQLGVEGEQVAGAVVPAHRLDRGQRTLLRLGLVELARFGARAEAVGDRDGAGHMIGQIVLQRGHLLAAGLHRADHGERGQAGDDQRDDQPDAGVETEAIEELGRRTHGDYLGKKGRPRRPAKSP